MDLGAVVVGGFVTLVGGVALTWVQARQSERRDEHAHRRQMESDDLAHKRQLESDALARQAAYSKERIDHLEAVYTEVINVYLKALDTIGRQQDLPASMRDPLAPHTVTLKKLKTEFPARLREATEPLRYDVTTVGVLSANQEAEDTMLEMITTYGYWVDSSTGREDAEDWINLESYCKVVREKLDNLRAAMRESIDALQRPLLPVQAANTPQLPPASMH